MGRSRASHSWDVAYDVKGSGQHLRQYGFPVTNSEEERYAAAAGCPVSSTERAIKHTLAQDDDLREFITVWDALERHGRPENRTDWRDLRRLLLRGRVSLDPPSPEDLVERMCQSAPWLSASLTLIKTIREYGCTFPDEYSRIGKQHGVDAEELKGRVFQRLVVRNLDVRRSAFRLHIATQKVVSEETINRFATQMAVSPSVSRELCASASRDLPNLRDISSDPAERLYVWLESSIFGTNLDHRLRIAVEEKRRTAKYVVGHYVDPSDRIALDVGSSALYVVLELIQRRITDLTVVTNNVAALPYLQRIERARAELIGGAYNADQGSLVRGTFGTDQMPAEGSLRCRLGIVSITSFDWRTGRLGVIDPEQLPTKRWIIDNTSGPVLFLFDHAGELYDPGRAVVDIADIGEEKRRGAFRIVTSTALDEGMETALEDRYRVRSVDVGGKREVLEIRAR